MQDVEVRYNKPLREVLKELYDKHGSVMKIANEIGVSQGTVSSWLLRHNLEVRSILIDLLEKEVQS